MKKNTRKERKKEKNRDTMVLEKTRETSHKNKRTDKTFTPERETNPKKKASIPGLPKIIPTAKSVIVGKEKKSKKVKSYKKIKKEKSKLGQFTTVNTTNINLIKEYFETICPGLYDKLARLNRYVLYQYNYPEREIYLVPAEMSTLVRHLGRSTTVQHAGILLGYFRLKKTRTGFTKGFFLSFEGGKFLYDLIKREFPEFLSKIQTVKLSEKGEKEFLYGQDLKLHAVTTPTENLKKKKLIFVLNQEGEYLGLALLRVQQAGINKPDEETGYKPRDRFSRSQNFLLSLMHLADAGYYLRKAG